MAQHWFKYLKNHILTDTVHQQDVIAKGKQMETKIKVEGLLTNTELKMKTYIHNGVQEKRQLLADKVIHREGKIIEEALIKLGWRPPNQIKVCDKCYEQFDKTAGSKPS